ncbi:hypothetical protein CVT24_007940 [Panaeolus cyanescens]|uniref:Uncharacterized protein n=1 Tax=Panaeolus cyanescens TaxID=181874 RepID=A0A409WD29_9AGAR|nr:hypothetical protein CVT24_007940 [Panaeolus cyanescens]
MILNHRQKAYDHCLSAIKLLTFRCLPFPSHAFADEEASGIEEECHTLTGYGISPVETGILYPCSSTGQRLVISRPRKARRKSWPSANNPAEVQAFHDKELSRSSTPAESRRSSRVSTPICLTPEPTTPITPSCPSLTASPSSCDSTLSVLDTPPAGYSPTATKSPNWATRLPLPVHKISGSPSRSGSPTPGAKGRGTASLLTMLPLNTFKTSKKLGSLAPVKIANVDEHFIGKSNFQPMDSISIDKINIFQPKDNVDSLNDHRGYNDIGVFPKHAPVPKMTGRIPRPVGGSLRRLKI